MAYTVQNIGGQMYAVPSTNNYFNIGIDGNVKSANGVPLNAIPLGGGTGTKVNTPANPAANYTPNAYTSAQLAKIPFQASPSMQQAYNAKMQGYGITPQPFSGSPQVNGAPAPVKGGK